MSNLTPLQELKNTASHNKINLKGRSIISNIDGSKYAIKINGVGNSAVRLSLFVSYDDILRYHNHKHLENILFNMINKVY